MVIMIPTDNNIIKPLEHESVLDEELRGDNNCNNKHSNRE